MGRTKLFNILSQIDCNCIIRRAWGEGLIGLGPYKAVLDIWTQAKGLTALQAYNLYRSDYRNFPVLVSKEVWARVSAFLFITGCARFAQNPQTIEILINVFWIAVTLYKINYFLHHLSLRRSQQCPKQLLGPAWCFSGQHLVQLGALPDSA